MRKYAVLLALAAVILFAFTACSSDGTPYESPQTPQNAELRGLA